MRRWTAVAGVLMVVTAGCGPTAATVGRARQGSWQRVREPAFTAGSVYGIAGLAAPADGYPSWTAVGSVSTGDDHVDAVVWTSSDGKTWNRTTLDPGGADQAQASGVAARAGRVVVGGTVIGSTGERRPRLWTAGPDGAWNVVPLPGEDGQSIDHVAAGALGFLVSGTAGAAPALWWSPDGGDWKRVRGPFGPDQAVLGLAVGKAGMVAVGTIETSGDVDGMVWFSADGTTWRTVPLGSAGFAGPAAQHVLAVTAAGDGGFVAVGDDANADRRFAVVWTSADGISWQRQPPSPDMGEVPGQVRTAGVGAAAVAGSGPFVAAGGGYSAQIWTSADGRRWARDESPVPDRASEDTGPVATDGRAQLVYVGGRGLYFRASGGTWTAVGTDATLFPTSARSFGINALVRAGGRLLAFGRARGPEGSSGAALWASYDGQRWERQPDQGDVFAGGSVAGVTTLGSLIVAAGTITSAGGNVAAVWTSGDGGFTWSRAGAGTPGFAIEGATQIFGIGTGGPGLVAVGLGFDDTHIVAHAWSSPDGRTWKRAADSPEWSGAGDHYLDVACALPDGTALVTGTATVRGKRALMAWMSKDGVAWEPTSPVTSGGAPPQFVTSCLSRPDGALLGGAAVGAGGDDAALWSTVDGHAWTALPGSAALARPGDDWVRALAADGGRLVATTLGDGQTAAWTSADGVREWRRWDGAGMRGLGTHIASEVVIAGDQVVAAGVAGSSAAVWIGPAP